MYDWYLVPVSSYWSVKKGCAPQQLIYNYGDKHIYAVNDEKEDMDLRAFMTVYGLDGTVLSDAECERLKMHISMRLKDCCQLIIFQFCHF